MHHSTTLIFILLLSFVLCKISSIFMSVKCSYFMLSCNTYIHTTVTKHYFQFHIVQNWRLLTFIPLTVHTFLYIVIDIFLCIQYYTWATNSHRRRPMHVITVKCLYHHVYKMANVQITQSHLHYLNCEMVSRGKIE